MPKSYVARVPIEEIRIDEGAAVREWARDTRAAPDMSRAELRERVLVMLARYGQADGYVPDFTSPKTQAFVEKVVESVLAFLAPVRS